MMFHLVTEEAFLELSVLREKAGEAIRCIIDDSTCRRAQTLADIASDYLSAMGETAEAMQKSIIVPPRHNQ